jgi:hypothetical protein
MVSKAVADAAARERAAAAAEEEAAPDKRNIQMKMFMVKEVLGKLMAGPPGKWYRTGQIVGYATQIVTKTGTLKDGTQKDSLLAIGEFEAVNDYTGEVMKSGFAYLPGYYLEVLKAKLSVPGTLLVGIAVDVGITATANGGVPYAYEVMNRQARSLDNPIEVMKRELQKSGALRLPPPLVPPARQIEHMEAVAEEEAA